MNILIIEDEKPAARRLARLLNNAGYTACQMLYSVTESIQWLEKNPAPDLIFLDIQLSDGLSFQIFESIKVQSPVIFTTAYDQYALQAFKLNSIDYLLKPIDEKKLESALQQFKNQQPQKQTLQFNFEEVKNLLTIPIERGYKKRFTIKIGQRLKIISVDEIECFYSQNKATYIFTDQRGNYLLDTSLESLKTELTPDIFFQVNRQFYVNINHIKDIISYTNSRLKLKLQKFDKQEIIVARERVKDFKLWLE